MQIDLKRIDGNVALCNLYTGNDGGRCVKIAMALSDYKALLLDGFFIRDGKTQDSADTLNTTDTYHKIRYVNGKRELAPL